MNCVCKYKCINTLQLKYPLCSISEGRVLTKILIVVQKTELLLKWINKQHIFYEN